MTGSRFPRRFAAVTCVVALFAVPTSAGPFRFEDVASSRGLAFRNVCGAPAGEKGWLTETMGAGAAWLDANGDGRLDLYLVNGSAHDRPAGRGEPNRLFLQGDDGRFVDATTRSGAGDRGWGHGVAVGDYDGDGDPDLYVANLGADVLLRNRGDGTFEDATKAAGLGLGGWSTSAAWFDLEGDGDLDLYVARYVDFDRDSVPRGGSDEARNRTTCTVQGVPVFCGPLGLPPQQDALYRNRGDGTFERFGKQAGIVLETPRYALGVLAADLDDDGDTDLYVANDSVANSLFRNDGKGRFTESGLLSLSAFSGTGKAQAGMGVALGDADGDGLSDLVVTNFSHDLNTLYRNAGRFYRDASTAFGLGVTQMALSWGVGFRDFDLDGREDLFIANGHLYPVMDRYDNGLAYAQRNHLFRNVGNRWTEVGADSGNGLKLERSWRGAAFADFDDDGDVDILTTSIGDAPALLENRSTRAGKWLRVDLVDPRRRSTVGAVVRVRAGERTWRRDLVGGGSYLSASEPTLHFGLGAIPKIDAIEVSWPGGVRERFAGGAPDRRVTLERGKGEPLAAANR